MAGQDEYNPFVISHCSRSSALEAKFKEFNIAYFNSALPRFRVMLCSKPRSFGHEAGGYCYIRGGKRRFILIRAGLSERSMEQTLIHEMTHAKLSWIRREIHGKKFISELRRLRKLGAPLSRFELDRVRFDHKRSREPPRLSKKVVRRLISSALLEEGLPPKAVPRYLEQELMLPIRVIENLVDVSSEVEKSLIIWT